MQIDATQSAALSEELRKSSISDAPVSLPQSRSEPVISLPLIPLPSPTTTTTPEPTTTTSTLPPTTTTTPPPTTTLPPLNDQEELFLSQLKALFPGDPSLDAKFNEYRQRMGTTIHPLFPHPSPPAPSPVPTTFPPTLPPTPSPSPSPSLPIRSYVFVHGKSLHGNTSPPISPVLSFLPSSEALPLRYIHSNLSHSHVFSPFRELSTEIHPLNRPHASSQPIAVLESFGRRSGALFINGKGEIVDGKGNRLEYSQIAKTTPDTVPVAPIPTPTVSIPPPIISQPIPPPQPTVSQPAPTVSAASTNLGTLEQLQRLQKLYEQYVHTINSAVSLPTVSQSTVPPTVSQPQVTSPPVVQSLPQVQYPSPIPRSLNELSSAQSLQQPTVVQTQPSVPQYSVATVSSPTVIQPYLPLSTVPQPIAALPTTVFPTASPVPTVPQVDPSQYTSKILTVPPTALPSTTVSPTTTTRTVPSSVGPSTVSPSVPRPYPSYPSYPSPYNPYYSQPPQSKVEAPVFERYSTWEVPAGAGDILKVLYLDQQRLSSSFQSNSTGNSTLPQTLLLVDPSKKANDPPTVIQLPPSMNYSDDFSSCLDIILCIIADYPSYPSSPQQSPPRGYYPPYPQYPYSPYGSPYGGAYPSYGGSSYGGWPSYPTPPPSTPHPLAKLFSQVII